MSFMDNLKRQKYIRNAEKASADGQHTAALGLLMLALKHTRDDKNETAKIKEKIAHTHVKLKNSEKARQYALASLEAYSQLYQKNKSLALKEAIARINGFLANLK